MISEWAKMPTPFLYDFVRFLERFCHKTAGQDKTGELDLYHRLPNA